MANNKVLVVVGIGDENDTKAYISGSDVEVAIVDCAQVSDEDTALALAEIPADWDNIFPVLLGLRDNYSGILTDKPGSYWGDQCGEHHSN